MFRLSRMTPDPRPVLCFGEILLRLSSPAGEMMLQSPRLESCTGGAEANVAVALARFGQAAAMVSVLPDNVLGRGAHSAVRGQGVDTSPVVFTPGRMGLYFLTPGAVGRPSDVIYDRAHSAFAKADLAALPWDDLLKGVSCLHISGITPATGRRGADGALAAVRAAAKVGVPVSFDGNFRGKLWAEWNDDPSVILRELFSHAQILFANDRDIALVLGETFDDADPLVRSQRAADAAIAAFPRLRWMASTTRTLLSASHHDLSAVLFKRGRPVVTSPARRLEGIVDRIGAGDAFAAGLLFSLLRGSDPQAALDFALAAACLKHSIAGDFTLADAADVEAVMARTYDVRR